MTSDKQIRSFIREGFSEEIQGGCNDEKEARGSV
jgi:hypothetical protein